MSGRTEDERLATLAVLAAAAKEAEEFLSAAKGSDEVGPESLQEADRRLKLFLRAGRAH
jgi:hypothetical protein